MPFVHGPILYLYTLALSSKSKVRLREMAFHFILPLFIVLLFIEYPFYSFEEKINVINTKAKAFKNHNLLAEVLLNISGVFYVIITYILLNRHKKRILNEFSYQEKIDLNWLRLLFYGMAIMWILIIIIQNDTLIFSASTIFVILIGFYGIKQTSIFKNQSAIEESENIVETLLDFSTEDRKKYAKSGLSDEAAYELHQKLNELMQEEKLYTEPELNLSDLAARLAIHPNYLSQVINELEGVNFYDYINTLRIEEFKRLVALPENQKFTFLALAFDCGFNSKSAFNRYFKKATGQSPSDYVKSTITG